MLMQCVEEIALWLFGSERDAVGGAPGQSRMAPSLPTRGGCTDARTDGMASRQGPRSRMASLASTKQSRTEIGGIPTIRKPSFQSPKMSPVEDIQTVGCVAIRVSYYFIKSRRRRFRCNSDRMKCHSDE